MFFINNISTLRVLGKVRWQFGGEVTELQYHLLSQQITEFKNQLISNFQPHRNSEFETQLVGRRISKMTLLNRASQVLYVWGRGGKGHISL